MEDNMENVLANDVRTSYERAFATVKAIAEAFPADKWLIAHGDDYYIPSRIAYHIAEFIDGALAGGFADPDFGKKLPFGSWYEGTAETLPPKDKFISYFDEVIGRANAELSKMTDAEITKVNPPEQSRFGATGLAVQLHHIREIAAHTGELNKMLIENGLDDIWK